MQVKGSNRWAKSFTAAEVRDVMEGFRDIAVSVMEEACGGNQVEIQNNQPIFSLDNASVHNDLEDITGVGPFQRAPLPPRSPDMHKVIEHLFNTLQYKLHRILLPAICQDYARNPEAFPPMFWVDVVEAVLKDVTVDSIRADIMTLPDTYQYIADHGGCHAPRPFN